MVACPCSPPPCLLQVVVVGRSTCPFCIEITRTLAGMGLSFPYFLSECLVRQPLVHALCR